MGWATYQVPEQLGAASKENWIRVILNLLLTVHGSRSKRCCICPKHWQARHPKEGQKWINDRRWGPPLVKKLMPIATLTQSVFITFFLLPLRIWITIQLVSGRPGTSWIAFMCMSYQWRQYMSSLIQWSGRQNLLLISLNFYHFLTSLGLLFLSKLSSDVIRLFCNGYIFVRLIKFADT